MSTTTKVKEYIPSAGREQASFPIASSNSVISLYWNQSHLTFEGIWEYFTNFNVVDKKDARCFVPGQLTGKRRANDTIQSISLFVYDFDSIATYDDVKSKLQNLDLYNFMYTSHSHMKTESKIRATVFNHWQNGNRTEYAEPTTDKLIEVLKAKGDGHFKNIKLTGINVKMSSEGKDSFFHHFTHDPVEKFRVVLPLAKPFIFDEQGKTRDDALDAFEETYAGVAIALGLDHFDPAGLRPVQPYYFPACSKENEDKRQSDVFEGDFLDFNDHPKADRAVVDKMKERPKLTKKTSPKVGSPSGRSKGDRRFAQKETVTKYGKLLKQTYYHERFHLEIASLIKEKAPEFENGGLSRSGGVYDIFCPVNEHSDPEKSGGAYCVDASKSKSGRFVFSCMHSDGLEYSEWDFLAALIESSAIIEQDIVDCADAERKRRDALVIDHVAKIRLLDGDIERFKAGKKRTKAQQERDMLAKAVTDIEFRQKLSNGAIDAFLDFKGITEAGRAKYLGRLDEEYALRALVLARGRFDELDADFYERYAYLNAKTDIVILDLETVRKGGEHPWVKEKVFKKETGEDDFIVYTDEFGNKQEYDPTEVWLNFKKKKKFKRLGFHPSHDTEYTDERTGDRVANAWTGWGFKANKGDWSKLKHHLLHNWCGGNEKSFNWLMTYFAHMIQHPEQKPKTAIVLSGEQSTGKSVVTEALKLALGQYVLIVSSSAKLKTNFNIDWLDKLFIQIEEAAFAKDPDVVARMKQDVAGEYMSFEAKFFNAFDSESFHRYVITTNNLKAVHLTGRERRYFVLSPTLPKALLDDDEKAKEYFDALYDEMHNGGVEAFLFELMHWEPRYERGWREVHNAPKTEAFYAQLGLSYTASENFFSEILLKGEITILSHMGDIMISWPLDEHLLRNKKRLQEDHHTYVIQPKTGRYGSDMANEQHFVDSAKKVWGLDLSKAKEAFSQKRRSGNCSKGGFVSYLKSGTRRELLRRLLDLKKITQRQFDEAISASQKVGEDDDFETQPVNSPKLRGEWFDFSTKHPFSSDNQVNFYEITPEFHDILSVCPWAKSGVSTKMPKKQEDIRLN